LEIDRFESLCPGTFFNHLALHSPLLETMSISCNSYPLYDKADREADYKMWRSDPFQPSSNAIYPNAESHPPTVKVELQHDSTESSSDESESPPPSPPPPPPVIHRFSGHLKFVTLKKIPYFDDRFTIEHLPNSVQTLSVSQEFDFTILSDEGIRPLSNWTNLTNLDLRSSQDITGGCFKFLPRYLEVLNAAAARWVWDHDFADLPRSLTDITLDNAKQLTNACLPFLPPEIERLSLASNKNITDNIDILYDHLPDEVYEEGLYLNTATFILDEGILKKKESYSYLPLRLRYRGLGY
jgi:hypothetical protein